MANMILGEYSFEIDPSQVMGLDADSLLTPKAVATADTLTSQVIFVWPAVVAGAEVVLEWERMDDAMWEQLQTMAESTSTYEFNPQVGATTWDVMVMSLTAQGRDPNGMSRVQLTLNIRGVA